MEESCGSTLIMLDLYWRRGDAVLRTMLSPRRLSNLISKIIAWVGMHERKVMRDEWEKEQVEETEDARPTSLFHSLEESHFRAETWPKLRHMNAEVQLCNFSRDNRPMAKRFVHLIIKRLMPATASILVIERGPGPRLRVLESIEWKRGAPLPFRE